jgi:hypothetical protein
LLRAKELQADFTSVRMCAISGEATTAEMREELRRCLRELSSSGTTVLDRYGSTEMGAFAQCREEGDWHNPTPEIQYHEVVDPDSGRRLPDGERRRDEEGAERGCGYFSYAGKGHWPSPGGRGRFRPLRGPRCYFAVTQSEQERLLTR